MQISKKQKKIFLFLCFWDLDQNLNIWKKYEPQSLYISEITDCERRVQINV